MIIQNIPFERNEAYEFRWESRDGEIGFELQMDESPEYPWLAIYAGDYIRKATGKPRRFASHTWAISAARRMMAITTEKATK